MVISSAQNSLFKWLKSLRVKKYRQREGCVLIEGKRLIDQVVKLGYSLTALVVEESVDLVEFTATDTHFLSAHLFKQLSDTVHSQGVIAVVRMANHSLDYSHQSPIVVLDRLQDPGNLGAILRTCEALGYQQVALTKGSADVYSAKVLRSAMGAVFSLTIVHDVDGMALMERLRVAKRKIVITALENSQPLTDLTVDWQSAIVFGNEGAGVSPAWQSHADQRVAIPMAGRLESLNVAVSVGIVLYHMRLHISP